MGRTATQTARLQDSTCVPKPVYRSLAQWPPVHSNPLLLPKVSSSPRSHLSCPLCPSQGQLPCHGLSRCVVSPGSYHWSDRLICCFFGLSNINPPKKKSLHEDNEREPDLGSQNRAWQQQPLEKEREERGTGKGERALGARTACPKPVARVGHRIMQVPGEREKQRGHGNAQCKWKTPAALPRGGRGTPGADSLQRHRRGKLEQDHPLGLGKELPGRSLP